METLPTTRRGSLTPDQEGRCYTVFQFHKNVIYNWNLVIHVSVWAHCVQFKYLFPNTDGALSNWKSSRLDLSVPLGSQHNKWLFHLNYITTYHSSYSKHSLLPLGNIHFSTWPGGNALSVINLQTQQVVIYQNHLPNYTVSSQNHSPKYTASIPRTTHPTTWCHIPEPLTKLHGVIYQEHSPNHMSYPRTTHPTTRRHVTEGLNPQQYRRENNKTWWIWYIQTNALFIQ
jgi:hypothetical protein